MAVSKVGTTPAKINAPLGLERWSPHAMRRTCATLAGEAGTHPLVLSAILGHSVIGSLLSGYNKSRYLKERAGALKAVADRLDRIEAGTDNNVIPLHLRGVPNE